MLLLVLVYACSKDEDVVSNPSSEPQKVFIYSVVSTPTDSESITIKNNSGSTQDLSGWTLGDKNDPTAYNIPNGTVLSNGSTKHFSRTTLGFQINDSGETIYLKNSSGSNVDTWSN